MRILLLPTSESHSAPLPPRFHSYFHPDIIRLPIPANVAVPTALAESGIEFGSSAHILFTLKTPLPGARGVKACHGAHVIDALGPRDEPADGMYLVEEERNLPREGRMLVMATADCLAVALHARVDGYVLAALTHAGWRGYSQGILLESLARLQRAADAKGIPQGKWLPHLTVVISPAIAGTCYPCGDDVRDALETHVKARLERLARFSRVASLVEECLDVTNTLSLVPYPGEDEAVRRTRLHPDLQSLAVCELVAAGIDEANIQVIRENTFGHGVFPSYRRSSLTPGGAKAGRLLTHLHVKAS